ncbi:MAG: hypothetical protein IKT89_05105 [Clostridia bacterium]|nr:hypothetical protein [Clostridia bacterium]
MRKFYTMDETGMQNTHITNRLKQFSKEVLFNSCTKADMPIQYGIVNMFNAVTYFDESIKVNDKLSVSSKDNKEAVTV